MDEATILELLRGAHFDMPERISRGIWPHPPLRYSDIVKLLAEYVRTHDSFPNERSPSKTGRAVAEGGRIQRLATNKYVYIVRRSDPLRPYSFAHTGEVVFTNAEDAARHFLRWDLHLPGDLDGWKVVEK